MGDAETNNLVPFQINYIWEQNKDLGLVDPLNPPTKPCNEAFTVNIISILVNSIANTQLPYDYIILLF